ncbi:MAG: peptide/nickel transport system substrate-binding protein [Micromonosporaceae bacterium]
MTDSRVASAPHQVRETHQPDGPLLRLLGPRRPAHGTAAGPYTIRSGQVLRLLTRQLFGYPGSRPALSAPDPVPDAATAVPTVDNGGLSPDRRTYRLHIRQDLLWDAQQARQLVSGDFIRGFKRIAFPTAARGRHYLTDTIEGMAEYCAAFQAAFGEQAPTAPDLAQFQRAHPVAGLSAVDSQTLEIRLRGPASDFLHILATGFAAAAPREYDYYVPDSHELYRNATSAGPYRALRRRSLGHDLVLEPNPRWQPDSDPIRARTAGLIEICADGGTEPPGAASPFAPASAVPGEPAQRGPNFLTCLVFNPDATGSVRSAVVRRAVAVAIERGQLAAAAAQVPGATARPLYGLVTPGSPGYREESAAGDPALARRLLADAGYRDGVRLSLRGTDTATAAGPVVDALSASLARAGIWLVPARRPDAWDLRLLDWTPDWYGDNGRAVAGALLRKAGGRYDSGVDRLVEAALAEPDPARTDQMWREVDLAVRREAPVIALSATECRCCVPMQDAGPEVHWLR